jgi:ketosteroid isomerase-like protein
MTQTASPEILARVKESFEWWNGGEPQLMLDDYAEDGELDLSAIFTDLPVFRGHEDMRRQIDEFWETWEGLRMDSLEVLDAGRGRFVVDVRLWGKGRRSGAEVDQRFAFLYTLRESDNLIVRAQLFPTAQAALDHAQAQS